MKFSIIGAGSFGSALATLATRCHHDVLLWAHDPRVAEAIATHRSNPIYLPMAKFSERVRVTSELAEAAAFSDTLIMVTPSHHYRSVLTGLAPMLPEGVRVLSATKGIENRSLRRISEISVEVLGDRLGAFASLSGPTFAVELAKGDPSAAVIASENESFASEMQNELSCRSFRAYRTDDVIGVETSGSLKNVIAIAAGVIEGLGYGHNTTAALITRGLHEIRKLGVALGGRHETFAGLAGVGDLVLTCTGSLSRNRNVGVGLGQGRTIDEILATSRLVAEGVKTALSARDLAEREGIDMPIVSEMYRVLYENESSRVAIDRLMTRALKAE